MATFTIDTDNNIAAHAAVPANLDNQQAFATEKELAKLSAEWPGSRLVDIWNSFAGVAPFTELKPVKKFANRKAAVARIWAAVQRLSPESAEQAPDVAPTKGKARSSPAKAPRRARERTEARQRCAESPIRAGKVDGEGDLNPHEIAPASTSTQNSVYRRVSSGLILLKNIAPRYRSASPSFLKPLQFHYTPTLSPGRTGSACYRLHHTPISCGLLIQVGRRSSHYSQERSRRPP